MFHKRRLGFFTLQKSVALLGYEVKNIFKFCYLRTFILREECRLTVFENKVLRRIFGPKRDEVTGDWRRLHKRELYALYFSPNIIRVIKSRRQMRRTRDSYG
jgi:hypothetical protein